MKVTVTHAVVTKLFRYAPPFWLRVRIFRDERTTQLDYALQLTTKLEEGEVEVIHNETRVAVLKSDVETLDGIVIDYHEGEEGKGFKIFNPNDPEDRGFCSGSAE